MNSSEKLTLQDLVDLLAAKQGMTKKDAEVFLRELINLTSESIENKDFVRIKKFGTFKLTEIKARKSIDVNTNETIEIPAHYRLNFVPDKELREAVNKPFAHFKSELISDDTPLDEQQQDVFIPVDTGDKANNEVQGKSEYVKEEPPKPEEKEETPIAVERVITYPKGVDIPDKISVEDFPHEESQSAGKNKRKYLLPVLIVCLLVLCGFGLYHCLESRSIRFKGWGLVTDDKPQISEPNKTEDAAVLPQVEEQKLIDSTKVTELMDEASSVDIQGTTVEVADKDSKESKYQETEIRYGDTMRKLGVEYYGHKSFWVYIYEENKDVIKDPNSVPVGTKLRIAPASKYGINANDSASRSKAIKLEGEIFKKFNIR